MKTKLISFALALLMLTAVFLTACADVSEGGGNSVYSDSVSNDADGSESEGGTEEASDYSLGLEFESAADGSGYVLVCMGTCTDAVVTIPAVYEGKPVTAIGDGAFKDCAAVVEIIIPSGVLSIGDGAFEGCIAIVGITLPQSVTAMGDGVFKGCIKLEMVNLPTQMTSIGSGAFEGCSSLEGVKIPEGVSEIGENTFKGCSSLTEVSLPTTAKSVGGGAFDGCSALENVTVQSKDVPTGLKGNVDDSKIEVEHTEHTWVDVEAKEPKCEEEGYKAYHYCSVCGENNKETVGATGHINLRTAVEENRVEARCEEDGSYDSVVYCECGKEMSRTHCTIGATGHINARPAVEENRVEAKCEEAGSYDSVVYCACGEEISRTPCTIGATGHINARPAVEENRVEAKCEEAGSYDSVVYCECGEEISRTPCTIGATGHVNLKSPVEENRVEPECEKDGSYESVVYCNCGKEVSRIPCTIDRTGHTEVVDEEAKAATCTQEGYTKASHCSVCTKPLSTKTLIEAKGHSYTNGECSECGRPAPSENLAYALNADGQSYTVTGKGDFTGWTLVIPATHEGLPVTAIGDFAFNDANGISSVYIPSSINKIGKSAFRDHIYGVHIDDIASWCSIEFANAYSSPIRYSTLDQYYTALYIDGEKVTDVVIPDGITKIGAYTFKQYYYLESVTLPDSVKIIDDCAFSNCPNLTSVNMPSDLEKIGNYAFNGAMLQGELVVPDKVTYLGEYAFFGCNFTKITIGSGISEILTYTFSGCVEATELFMGKNVRSVGAYAFDNMSSLTAVHISDIRSWAEIDFNVSLANPLISAKKLYLNGTQLTGEITIPEGTTKIGSYAFMYDLGITKINLPSSVKSIGEGAFRNTKLTGVKFSEGLESIGKDAFYYCSSLSISNSQNSLPSSLNSIGYNAFYNCNITTVTNNNGKYLGNSSNPYLVLISVNDNTRTSFSMNSRTKIIFDSALSGFTKLTSITIPDSVTCIGYRAFYNCSALATVNMGSGVQVIGENAFYNCKALASIEIPAGVTRIEGAAFQGCTALKNVYITDLAAWCRIDLVNSGSNPMYNAIGNLYLNDVLLEGEVTIPEGVTQIKDYAFYNLGNVTEFVFPRSLESIGSMSFTGCAHLTTLILPDSVKSIGGYAFSNCTALKTVDLGSVVSLGSYAFNNCRQITSMDLGASLESIGAYAFRYCTGVKNWTLPASVNYIGDYAFDGTNAQTVVFEDTEGWMCYHQYNGYVTVESERLANSQTAAGYLKNNYKTYTWTKE